MKDKSPLARRILWLIPFAGLGGLFFLDGLAGAQQGPTPSWINYFFGAMWIFIGIGHFSRAVRLSIAFKGISTFLSFFLIGVVQYYEQHNWILVVIAAIFVIWSIWFYKPLDQVA